MNYLPWFFYANLSAKQNWQVFCEQIDTIKKLTEKKDMAKKVQKTTHSNKKGPNRSGATSGLQGKTRAPKKKTGKSSASNSSSSKMKLEIQEWKEKYLRLSAEFDNFRKRTLREKADLMKFAGEDFILSLLPILDDFDRAVHSIDQTKDIEALQKGIMLIYNKFEDFLKQKGIQEIESMHADFDTDHHEAITKIPAPEKKLKGKVIDVIAKGYELNGKVIRHSKVVVGD